MNARSSTKVSSTGAVAFGQGIPPLQNHGLEGKELGDNLSLLLLSDLLGLPLTKPTGQGSPDDAMQRGQPPKGRELSQSGGEQIWGVGRNPLHSLTCI